VLEGSERGYGDVITAMFAYSPETKTITGFTVLEMRETPGLGAKIGNDPEFLSNFKALDTSEPIETVKHGTKKKASQIDAISGATISSRAVGRLIEKAVREMHPVLERHRDRIQRGN
jgi:electron transport complex protein RnfG